MDPRLYREEKDKYFHSTRDTYRKVKAPEEAKASSSLLSRRRPRHAPSSPDLCFPPPLAPLISTPLPPSICPLSFVALLIRVKVPPRERPHWDSGIMRLVLPAAAVSAFPPLQRSASGEESERRTDGRRNGFSVTSSLFRA